MMRGRKDEQYGAASWPVLAIIILLVILAGTAWQYWQEKTEFGRYKKETSQSLGSLQGLVSENEKLKEEKDILSKEQQALLGKVDELQKSQKAVEELNKRLAEKAENALSEKKILIDEFKKISAQKDELEGKLSMDKDRVLVTTLKENAALEVELEKTRGALTLKDEEIKRVDNMRSVLQSQIDALSQIKAELVEKIETETQVADSLAQELAKEKENTDGLRSEVNQANEKLRDKLARIAQVKASLEELIEKTQTELKEQIEAIELGKIVVKPEEPKKAKKERTR